MRTVAVVQARMGSSRLPGKVMLPLDCQHALQHVCKRARAAETIDQVVVATTDKGRDDVIARFSDRWGFAPFRGKEDDVLGRIYQTALREEADIVVRITGDCPLLSHRYVDYAVRKLRNDDLDYVSCSFDITFPRGITAEAFTFESFQRVQREAADQQEREHVTVYYRENPDSFDVSNIVSTEVFDDPILHGRTDLRLTLDEAADYDLLKRVFDGVESDGLITLKDAVAYVDENDLGDINETVQQKQV